MRTSLHCATCVRKRKTGRKFGRTSAKRAVLVWGVAESLFRHGRVRTTEARAKEARRVAERAITTAKSGNLAARRRLERTLPSNVAKNLCDEIAPRFRNRSGGYTRITKLAPRSGDRAPMVYLELLS